MMKRCVANGGGIALLAPSSVLCNLSLVLQAVFVLSGVLDWAATSLSERNCLGNKAPPVHLFRILKIGGPKLFCE